MALIRPDMALREMIEKEFDFQSITHMDLHVIFFDSIKSIFTSREFLQKYRVSQPLEEKIGYYLHATESYLNDTISEKTLRSYASQAWREHDPSVGTYKEILRTIISSMGSMKEGVEDHGADFVFGFLFSNFRHFDVKYAEQLHDNIVQHPKMQKYRFKR